MEQEIKETLKQAAECLQDAKVLLAQERYKATVSRSYYAMYHSAKATLLSISIETYTHQGVNTQFAKHFVKTGVFDKSLIKTFSKLLEKRLKSDYEIGFNADKEDADYAYNEAIAFYSTIIDYLKVA